MNKSSLRTYSLTVTEKLLPHLSRGLEILYSLTGTEKLLPHSSRGLEILRRIPIHDKYFSKDRYLERLQPYPLFEGRRSGYLNLIPRHAGQQRGFGLRSQMKISKRARYFKCTTLCPGWRFDRRWSGMGVVFLQYQSNKQESNE